ncbi:MAG: multicopper oxidase domain-containing protein, partial [Oceanospirillales bacterium]|nr:multicopper oxidase domain-containing protein [Oceanospirillales bacterium]
MKQGRRDFIRLAAISLAIAPGLGTASTLLSPRRLKLMLQPEMRHWFAPMGEPVALWGFDHESLRLRQGEPVELEVENRLPDPSSVHWHGMRIDNAMDGVSGLTQNAIPPGGTFVYRFTPQDAGTFWAHSHHKTYEQLARGLYMPLIVEEPTPVQVDRELTLALDDWRLDASRQVDTKTLGDMHDWAHGGRMGNLLTVNRQIKPHLRVRAGERVRLRLLNVANARILVLNIPSVRGWVWAKDGQPLTRPLSLPDALILAPAERYDLVIDIPDNAEGSLPIQLQSDDGSVDLARLQVDGRIERRWQDEPTPLPANPLPVLGQDAATHRIQLDMTGGAMGSLRQAVYQGETLGIRDLVQKHQIWAFNGVA